MNKEAHLVPESPAGWTIGWTRIPKDGKPQMEGFLMHFEMDRPHEVWLKVFRTLEEAQAHVEFTLPADTPEGYKWAFKEFTALDLLEFLTEYPEIEGVLFDLGSDGTHFVPANVLLEVLERHLGAQESDAA